MCRSELYFPIRTDIRVLEKKFKELESRLTLQNPDQGLTLRELANLHTSRIPTEDSEIGTQQSSERLQIELAKVGNDQATVTLVKKDSSDIFLY